MMGFFRRLARQVPGPGKLGGSQRFSATELGWACDRSDDSHDPVHSYLLQLLEEGRAREVDGGWVVPWPDLYELKEDEAHASSLPLLSLPPETAEQPVLSSRGSPSDPDFQIAVEGWAGPDGRVERLPNTGAVLDPEGDPRLLPEATYRLLDE